MNPANLNDLFSEDHLRALFPAERSDRFFEALYGDVSEGAYDIRLSFQAWRADALEFRFDLHRRKGKCLVCSLTYGLPKVFARHPVIDVKGLVTAIEKTLDGRFKCRHWEIGDTLEISGELHAVPLTVFIESVP